MMIVKKGDAVRRKKSRFLYALGLWAAFLALHFGLNAILGLFGLKFARYVTYAVCIVGAVWALLLLLYTVGWFYATAIETEKYPLKRFVCAASGVLLSLLWIAGLGSGFIFAVYTVDPTHIVERDGKKYVAEVTVFLSTRYVEYYDYKNIFVCGKQVRIAEDYCDGTDDPLKEDTPILEAQYYDENGRLTDWYENPDAWQYPR